MTRFDRTTGEPDPFSDSWLDIPLLPDERPSRPLLFAWIVGAALLSIALGLALIWIWTR
jgi:uncharacterized protein involved in exopolysaccharide biosynthesis